LQNPNKIHPPTEDITSSMNCKSWSVHDEFGMKPNWEELISLCSEQNIHKISGVQSSIN